MVPRHSSKTQPRPRPQPEIVLTKALRRAAERLGFEQKDVAALLGLSEASISRTYQGTRLISPDTNEGEKALYFLRIYRSLDSIVGGEQEKARETESRSHGSSQHARAHGERASAFHGACIRAMIV